MNPAMLLFLDNCRGNLQTHAIMVSTHQISNDDYWRMVCLDEEEYDVWEVSECTQQTLSFKMKRDRRNQVEEKYIRFSLPQIECEEHPEYCLVQLRGWFTENPYELRTNRAMHYKLNIRLQSVMNYSSTREEYIRTCTRMPARLAELCESYMFCSNCWNDGKPKNKQPWTRPWTCPCQERECGWWMPDKPPGSDTDSEDWRFVVDLQLPGTRMWLVDAWYATGNRNGLWCLTMKKHWQKSTKCGTQVVLESTRVKSINVCLINHWDQTRTLMTDQDKILTKIHQVWYACRPRINENELYSHLVQRTLI